MFDRLREAGFEVEMTSHALAILEIDFPELVGEIETALLGLRLPITEIIGGGGGEAKMTQRLRHALSEMGWPKHNFVVTKTVDGVAKEFHQPRNRPRSSDGCRRACVRDRVEQQGPFSIGI